MSIRITHNVNGISRTIIIDTLHNSIECAAPGNINSVMALKHNQSHVIRLNKCSVSTCNIEMLIYALQNDISAFNAVFNHVSKLPIVDNNYNLTIAAFYMSFNDDLTAWIEFFRQCSHETRKQILLDHICFNHEAKMSGVVSMSTYVGMNAFCQARCNNCDNAICKYCYSVSLTNQRNNLKNKLIRLHMILTNIELSKKDIPIIDSSVYPFFRFESFGDINNTTQVNNYNLIAACNSSVNFTLWSKNPGIIQAAINDGMILADNLVIGLSSLYLNTPELDKSTRYSFIRFLFTVYDDDYIRKHNVIINCGAKHCVSCGICYKYLHENNGGLMIINERKK